MAAVIDNAIRKRTMARGGISEGGLQPGVLKWGLITCLIILISFLRTQLQRKRGVILNRRVIRVCCVAEERNDDQYSEQADEEYGLGNVIRES